MPKSCCGCISLRTGTIIVLVLSIIGSILGIFGYIFNDQNENIYYYKYDDYYYERYSSIFHSKTASGILLIKSIIDLIFTIAAIIGVLSFSSKILRFYAIYLLIELVIVIVVSVIFLFMFEYISEHYGIVYLLIIIITIIIQIYFICVIYSYCDQLRKERKEEKEITADANVV